MSSSTFEKFDKKKNLRKVHYSAEDLDIETLKQIENYEQQALELRRQLGMFCSIYIPADHSAMAYGLILKGVRLMWLETREGKSAKRMYGTVEAIEVIEKDLNKEIDEIILNHIKYDGQRYIRVKLLMEREQNIVMVTGRSEHLFLDEIALLDAQ